MRKDVTHAYPLLDSLERFRLVMLAQARGDAADRDRLLRTAPRVRASLRDPGFDQILEAVREVLGQLVPACTRAIGWIEALEPRRDLVAFLGSPAELQELPLGSLLETLGGARTLEAAAAEIRALRAAFDRLCEEHGLDALPILQALCPGLAAALRVHAGLLAERDPEPGTVNDRYACLAEAWHRTEA